MDSWCWYSTQISLLSSTAGQYCPPSAVKVLVAQLCLTLCDPMDCSPPGSSAHGILQTGILEWVAFPFSKGSSRPRVWTSLSCIADRFFTVWATRDEYRLKMAHSWHSSLEKCPWPNGGHPSQVMTPFCPLSRHQWLTYMGYRSPTPGFMQEQLCGTSHALEQACGGISLQQASHWGSLLA